MSVISKNDMGAPVPGQLFRKDATGNEVGLSFLDSGELTFPESDCKITTLYKVIPDQWTLYEIRDNRLWRSCSSEPIEFVFRVKSFAVTTAGVYQHVTGEANWTDQTAPAGFSLFVEAYLTGDYGAASYLGTEASAYFSKQGMPNNAQAFKQLAWSAAVDGIAAKGAIGAVEGVAYDPFQELYVISPAGKAALETYQSSLGLAGDGRVNWQTMKSLSPYPDQLGELRAELLTKLK